MEWLAQKVLYTLKLSMYIRKVPAIADTMFCEGGSTQNTDIILQNHTKIDECVPSRNFLPVRHQTEQSPAS